jgi:general stress protein 26
VFAFHPRVDLRLERRRIRERLQRADVAMFVTLDDRGVHAGRPMLPLWLDNDPNIYFLTHESSRKVGQIAERPPVALTIITADCYFVVLGSASASRDPELIRRLWHPSYRAWFPAGKGDREATVLRVVVDRINYWEPPRSRTVRVFQAIKALVTRQVVDTPMNTIEGPV